MRREESVQYRQCLCSASVSGISGAEKWYETYSVELGRVEEGDGEIRDRLQATGQRLFDLEADGTHLDVLSITVYQLPPRILRSLPVSPAHQSQRSRLCCSSSLVPFVNAGSQTCGSPVECCEVSGVEVDAAQRCEDRGRVLVRT
jgi:hypothetical protein